MPRGRSTFTKRQKEQTRQQKQRDKTERRNQRKDNKPEDGVVVDEMQELRELAEAQAALFRIGDEDEPGHGSVFAHRKDRALEGKVWESPGRFGLRRFLFLGVGR